MLYYSESSKRCKSRRGTRTQLRHRNRNNLLQKNSSIKKIPTNESYQIQYTYLSIASNFSNYLPNDNSRQISRDVKGDDPSTDAHKKLCSSIRGEVGEKIEKEKKREREKEKERGEKWEGKKERTRSKFPCLFLLDSFSLLGWSFVASRLREIQVREKKGGRGRVKRCGKGRNTKHKKRILVDTSSSSSSCLATLLFNVLPREERSSSPSCENTPPPLVCVYRSHNARQFSRSWSHTRSIEISPDEPQTLWDGWRQINPLFAQKRGVAPPERRNNWAIRCRRIRTGFSRKPSKDCDYACNWKIRRSEHWSRYETTDRIGAKVTTKRGRRDDWRTQTDSNAVASRFSRGAATLHVPTPLVEGAHARSVRLRLVSLPFASFPSLLASSFHPPSFPFRALCLSFRRIVSWRIRKREMEKRGGIREGERNDCRESFLFFSRFNARSEGGKERGDEGERNCFLEKEEEGEENLVKIFLFYTFFLFFFVSRSISTRAPLRS